MPSRADWQWVGVRAVVALVAVVLTASGLTIVTVGVAILTANRQQNAVSPDFAVTILEGYLFGGIMLGFVPAMVIVAVTRASASPWRSLVVLAPAAVGGASVVLIICWRADTFNGQIVPTVLVGTCAAGLLAVLASFALPRPTKVP